MSPKSSIECNLSHGSPQQQRSDSIELEVQRKQFQTLAKIDNTANGLSGLPSKWMSNAELDKRKGEISIVLQNTWFGYEPKEERLRSKSFPFFK
jgi:hypothetical protein